jgi:hypothetical protein
MPNGSATSWRNAPSSVSTDGIPRPLSWNTVRMNDRFVDGSSK